MAICSAKHTSSAGMVSRSGYYAARRRASQPKRVCIVTPHLKAAFAESGQSYGSRHLRVALHGRGLAVSRYRIRALMRINNLRPVWKRKFIHTTDSKHTLPIADNVLNRQFQPDAANRAWVADITYKGLKNPYQNLKVRRFRE